MSTLELPLIGYLGPKGTFTSEALATLQPTLAHKERAYDTIEEVMHDTARGNLDYGFVPIENSIEGTVTTTVDALLFLKTLSIQREVEIAIHQNLLTQPGVDLASIDTIYSFPHAVGQCRKFLASQLPNARIFPTRSTAEGAQIVARAKDSHCAAIGPAGAADLFELALTVRAIEDEPDNTTRFILVQPHKIPRPTGLDKTTIACFPPADRPGSLLSILAPFAARGINLTKIESRPVRTELGVYYFVIDLEGHIAEPLIQAAMHDLVTLLPRTRLLGSYPRANKQDATTNDPVPSWPTDLSERLDPLG
jgi:prephenate dehydratase